MIRAAVVLGVAELLGGPVRRHVTDVDDALGGLVRERDFEPRVDRTQRFGREAFTVTPRCEHPRSLERQQRWRDLALEARDADLTRELAARALDDGEDAVAEQRPVAGVAEHARV